MGSGPVCGRKQSFRPHSKSIVTDRPRPNLKQIGRADSKNWKQHRYMATDLVGCSSDDQGQPHSNITVSIAPTKTRLIWVGDLHLGQSGSAGFCKMLQDPARAENRVSAPPALWQTPAWIDPASKLPTGLWAEFGPAPRPSPPRRPTSRRRRRAAAAPVLRAARRSGTTPPAAAAAAAA